MEDVTAVVATPVVEPSPVIEVPQPVPTAIDAPVKMEETTNEGRSLSEEELMKLKKINFKKKVSGELIMSVIQNYPINTH